MLTTACDVLPVDFSTDVINTGDERLYYDATFCKHVFYETQGTTTVHHVQSAFAKYTIYLVAVGQGSTTNVLKISDMSFLNALPMLPFAHAPNMLSSLPHPFYLLLLNFVQYLHFVISPYWLHAFMISSPVAL